MTFPTKINALILLALALPVSGCFQVEGDLIPQGPAGPRAGITAFLENPAQVLMEVGDEAGDLAWLYGAFDAAGRPARAEAVGFQPAGRSSRYYVLLDGERRVRYLFAERGAGDRLPALLRLDYPGAGLVRLSLFGAAWDGAATLEWQVDVYTGGGDLTPLPVYVRDECEEVRRLRDQLAAVVPILQRVLPSAFLAVPAWLRVDALAALPGFLDLLGNACARAPRLSATAPSQDRVPGSPLALSPLLDGLTPLQPCSGASLPAFDVERLEGNRVRFANISGGQGPFTFSLGGSPWQPGALFEGDYREGQDFLMAVRGGNGCVAARIGRIGPVRPPLRITRIISRQRPAGAAEFTPEYLYDFTYDDQGRVAEIAAPISASQTRRYRYTYGPNGQLLRYASLLTAGSTVNLFSYFDFSYDNQGMVASMDFTNNGGAAFALDVRYDASGRVTRLEKSAAEPTVFTYDGRGNLSRVQIDIAGPGGLASRLYTYGFSDQEPDPMGVLPVYFEPLHGSYGAEFLLPVIVNRQRRPFRLNLARIVYETGDRQLVEYSYRYDAANRLAEVTFVRTPDGSAHSFLFEYNQ